MRKIMVPLLIGLILMTFFPHDVEKNVAKDDYVLE